MVLKEPFPVKLVGSPGTAPGCPLLVPADYSFVQWMLRGF